MNDLGIGNHTGEPLPIRPLLPHPSHADTLGACHILRNAIAHEYRFMRGNLESLQRRREDLGMGFADADILPNEFLPRLIFELQEGAS